MNGLFGSLADAAFNPQGQEGSFGQRAANNLRQFDPSNPQHQALLQTVAGWGFGLIHPSRMGKNKMDAGLPAKPVQGTKDATDVTNSEIAKEA